MGKNNSFINYMGTLAKINRNDIRAEVSKSDTVQIYSAVAIALYNLLDGDHDEKVDSINQVFNESLKAWEEAIDKDKDIVDICKEVTGITMIYDEDK